MKAEIRVPPLGESVVEATIGVLLKDSGSLVRESEEICELETEKVNQVLYAPTSGAITWSVKVGDVVKIGAIIGTIESGLSKEEKTAPKKETEKPEKAQKQPEEPKKEVRKEEPLIQAKIEEKRPSEKPDLKERDLSQAPERQTEVSSKALSFGPERRQKMTTIRKTIAKKLIESMRNTAMLTTFNEVDMTELMSLRERYKEPFQKKFGMKLGLTSFFVRAAVDALKAFPEINAYIDGDEIVFREYYHIAIAVGGAKGGLVTPVLKNVDQMSFHMIESKMGDLATRAREGKLKIDDLEGASFTITNGGIYGSLLSTPLLSPKQSGILGMHKIEKRAVVINDQITIRPMMFLALSYDHRLVDGKEAIGFLIHIKEILEDPTRLIIMEDEPHMKS